MIAKIVDCVHFIAIDNAWEYKVFRWGCNNFFDFSIPIGDFPERKSARPQKLNMRKTFCTFHKVEDAFSGLQLTCTDDGELVRV